MLGPPSVGRSILVYIAYLSPIDDDEILPHIHANTTGVAWVSKRTPYRRASVVQKRVVVQGVYGHLEMEEVGMGDMCFRLIGKCVCVDERGKAIYVVLARTHTSR